MDTCHTGVRHTARPIDTAQFIDSHIGSMVAGDTWHSWLTLSELTGLSRPEFDALRPVHQRMVYRMAIIVQEGGSISPTCLAPGADPALRTALSRMQEVGAARGGLALAFQSAGRWNVTALDPDSQGLQGDPTILTYSFPPDGTFIPEAEGFPQGVNDLHAYLDFIYDGDRQAWQDLYHQAFARWGELCGITYQFEPHDDGVPLFQNPGVPGVRGDLRLAGNWIDGPGNVVAFNPFPSNGDMVIDTADTVFSSTLGNSRLLRNVIGHEHGHGMGQLHVCPIEANKLMEPTVSTLFDGPQFHDVLTAQRLYGDTLEPNDTLVEASEIGDVEPEEFISIELVSLDDDTDVDVYRFTLLERTVVRATVTPLTEEYQAGVQTDSCTEPAPYDPIDFLDPEIALLSESGLVLASGASEPRGEPETAELILDPGVYFVEVRGSIPIGDQIIAYRLDLDTQEAVFVPASLAVDGGFPTALLPGVPRLLSLTLDPGSDVIATSPALQYRFVGQTEFTTVIAAQVSETQYFVQLPAFSCGQQVEMQLRLFTQSAGLVITPSDGPVNVGVATSTELIADNAETNIGWTVSGDATDGAWARGIPVSVIPDEPSADFDGSGQAWLTGPGSFADVDGGETRLTSPIIDGSGGGTISYGYWASDSLNPVGSGDGFFVEYSTNLGATWTRVRDYDTDNQWRTDAIDIGSELTLSQTLQIRFIAREAGSFDLLEAGVDAIRFELRQCSLVPGACSVADTAAPIGQLSAADIESFLGTLTDLNGDLSADAIDLAEFFAVVGLGCPD